MQNSGISSYDFSKIKLFEQRYDALNAERIRRAMLVMTNNARFMFTMVPVFLHLNHPLLRSTYLSGDVPHGIYGFEMNLEQRDFVENLTKASGSYEKPVPSDKSILGLYCMGSTSSIGQTQHSDVDYWVCVSKDISPDREKLLNEKCLLITNMAATKKVNISFFIVHDDKFRTSIEDSADEESCGSAQHMFLLDEFYRSAICLGGKKLIWMLVPKEMEQHYDNYVKAIFENGILNSSEWLDLGSVGHIPPEEYYGSALWLLYKGIDYPFKAVIKILLMEAYSAEYPNTKLVSVEIRDWMQNNEGYSRNLDSYYMVYSKIAGYLKIKNDTIRERLLRMCFYQKISDGVDQIYDYTFRSQKRGEVQWLIQSWDWNNSNDFEFINSRLRWKNNEVKQVYGLILNALMNSYRELLEFGEKNHISDAINFQDINVLSRKLFAAFDVYDGKIRLYNMSIGKKISESILSFIQVVGSDICKNGWYLYTCSLDPMEIIEHAPSDYNSDIDEMISACVFNGVAVGKTEYFVKSQNNIINGERIHAYVNDLIAAFPPILGKPDNHTLMMPPEVRDFAVFINLVDDPTMGGGYRHISAAENVKNFQVFSAGKNGESMVGSITFVYRNSWNENCCLSYSKQNSNSPILHFIHDFCRIIRPGPHAAQVRWNIYNYSIHMIAYIKIQTEELLKRIIQAQSGIDRSNINICIDDEDYVLRFSEIGLDISQVSQTEQEIPAIPPVVAANIAQGFRQFFFMKTADGLTDIFETDIAGNVSVHSGFTGQISELVHSINSHYSKELELGPHQNIRYKQYFNLPQYYEISDDRMSIKPLIV